jgi:hypothetical protein
LDFDAVLASEPFKRLWPSVNLGGEVVATPVVDHGLLVVCTRRGAVHVLNRFTGEQLASLKLAEGFCFALIHQHMLIVTNGNRVFGYDLLESFRNWTLGRFRLTERWHQSLETEMLSHPPNSLTEDSFLVCSEANQGMVLHCLKCADGEPYWSKPARVPVRTSAPVSDFAGSAYLLGTDRKVHRVDAGSGAIEASASAATLLNVDVAPAWMDSTLFFLDDQGALCSCRTDSDSMVPARVSELTLLGVRGFALSPRGILVSHGRGLTKLSLSGQLIWPADLSMNPMSSSPVLVGDCGLAVAQDRSVAYLCDFKGPFLRFHQFLVTNDLNLAPPAFAGNVLYTCSLRGEVNALRVNTM